ncbi:DUF6344 domain-containing protein [Streptomyces sp. NPDC058371]|uniref:DUF6344 domain-containing protein n=1 Tax=Streptomyces sp. NPDC058371 TaxID=3346463 RepID=UPI00365DA00C
MAQNKVMKLWSTVVTALLALCTALGLITTTAAAAVPQASSARNTGAHSTAPTALAPWASSNSRALPPTMKQRIRAEAHGSSPSCRHRPTTDDDDTDDGTDADATEIDVETGPDAAAEAATEAVEPLHR